MFYSEALKQIERPHFAGDALLFMRRVVLFAFSISVLVIAVNFTGAAARGDEIRLKRTAVILNTAKDVRVGDVADITGAKAGEAAAISLGRVSELRDRENVGSDTVVITLADLRHALASRGVNQGRIAFSGDRCRVRFVSEKRSGSGDSSAEGGGGVRGGGEGPLRSAEPGQWASEVLEDGTLRSQIAWFICDQMQHREAGAVRLLFSDRDESELKLSVGLHEFEIIPQASSASPQVPFLVRVFQGNRFIRSLRIVVGVRLQQDVYVAQRYLSRDDAIRPSDFEVRSMLLEPSSIPPAPITENLKGRDARGRIMKGQILRVGDVIDPVSVRRNQLVDLIVKRGSFTISMRARAMDSGRRGDVIPVRPAGRKSELKAIIGSEGTLTVVGSE